MSNFPDIPDTATPTPVGTRSALATDVPGAVRYTRQSRAQLYKHMRAGLLPAYKNGTRTIIFYDDLDRYMRALPRAKFHPLADKEGMQSTGLPAVAASLEAAKRQMAELQELIAAAE